MKVSIVSIPMESALLILIFTTLKFTEVVGWSWWWVFSPMCFVTIHLPFGQIGQIINKREWRERAQGAAWAVLILGFYWLSFAIGGWIATNC